MAARNVILKYVRVKVVSAQTLNLGGSRTPSFNLFHRQFSEEARNSFRDKSDVVDRVITVVREFKLFDPAKVTMNAHFQKDLGLDNLQTVYVIMALEEEFGFSMTEEEAEKIRSIDRAIDFIYSHPRAK